MNLKPLSEYQQLRTLKDKEDKVYPDLYSRSNTLILIKKDSRAAFATGVGQKTELLRHYDEEAGDALILIWAGQWSSDPFLIDKADFKNLNAE